FQNSSGWAPHYTESGVDRDFQPVCFGSAYISDGDSPRVSFSLSAAGVRVVLLDIEGTTTPVDFVYGTLFPFARQRVQTYLEAAASVDPEIKAAVDELHKQHEQDAATGQTPPGWLDQSG